MEANDQSEEAIVVVQSADNGGLAMVGDSGVARGAYILDSSKR